MANYLFMATIPSIGKLISSSRRTEDIWAGSMLVSYLIKSALKEIKDKYNTKLELIFPSKIESIDSDFADISNKILLILNDCNQDDVKNLAEHIKKTVAEHMKKITDFALSECKISDTEYKELACYQIENTIELFWAATEISDEYKKSRQELEDYIGYLKDSHLRKDRMYQGYVLINSDLEIQKESFDEFQKKTTMRATVEVPTHAQYVVTIPLLVLPKRSIREMFSGIRCGRAINLKEEKDSVDFVWLKDFLAII